MSDPNPYESPTTLDASAPIEPPRGSTLADTILPTACWLQIGCLIGLFSVGLYEVGSEGLSYLGWIGLLSFFVIDVFLAIFIIVYSLLRSRLDWLLAEALVIGVHLACWLWASIN
ncbi:MAG: hypothetical protein QM811_25625 [Pirellulales bacterium]